MMPVAFILGARAFTDIYGEECLALLEPHARLLGRPCTAVDLQRSGPAWLAEVEALFTGWDAPRLDAVVLAKMPRLRAVFYGAGSVRPLVTEALWERGILLSSAAALNALPVVQYTTGAILLSLKRVWHQARHIRATRTFHPLQPLPVATGCGGRVGLMSLGLIGRGVAEQLRAQAIEVLAYDPFLTEEKARELDVRRATLDELFETCDVVSIHTPLLAETTGLVDKELLARLRFGATLINTARGAIIHTSDLIEVLRERPDLQAILDVTDPEPPPAESPLYDLENVFLTPHIAGSIGPECRRMGRAMIDEFKRFQRGEGLHYGVTKEQFALMA